MLEVHAQVAHDIARRERGNRKNGEDSAQLAFMLELSAFEGWIGPLSPGFGHNPHWKG